MNLRRTLFALVLCLSAPLSGVTIAKELPPAPKTYVVAEEDVLGQEARYAIQTVLSEHAKLTGEQVVIAIFKSLDGEDLVDWTNRVFRAWKIGDRKKDNGVLLALYWQDHRARLEVGYGLEPVLTDAKSKMILENILIPALKARNPDNGLSQAVLEILRTLGSPLIQSGQANQIFRESGVNPSSHSTGAQSYSSGWINFLILGVIFFMIAFNLITARDAHFTSSGWYRLSPWRRRWGGGSVRSGFPPFFPMGGGTSGGGGGWGNWGSGGGGGFSGGGGSSGGGGASGSW